MENPVTPLITITDGKIVACDYVYEAIHGHVKLERGDEILVRNTMRCALRKATENLSVEILLAVLTAAGIPVVHASEETSYAPSFFSTIVLGVILICFVVGFVYLMLMVRKTASDLSQSQAEFQGSMATLRASLTTAQASVNAMRAEAENMGTTVQTNVRTVAGAMTLGIADIVTICKNIAIVSLAVEVVDVIIKWWATRRITRQAAPVYIIWAGLTAFFAALLAVFHEGLIRALEYWGITTKVGSLISDIVNLFKYFASEPEDANAMKMPIGIAAEVVDVLNEEIRATAATKDTHLRARASALMKSMQSLLEKNKLGVLASLLRNKDVASLFTEAELTSLRASLGEVAISDSDDREATATATLSSVAASVSTTTETPSSTTTSIVVPSIMTTSGTDIVPASFADISLFRRVYYHVKTKVVTYWSELMSKEWNTTKYVTAFVACFGLAVSIYLVFRRKPTKRVLVDLQRRKKPKYSKTKAELLAEAAHAHESVRLGDGLYHDVATLTAEERAAVLDAKSLIIRHGDLAREFTFDAEGYTNTNEHVDRYAPESDDWGDEDDEDVMTFSADGPFATRAGGPMASDEHGNLDFSPEEEEMPQGTFGTDHFQAKPKTSKSLAKAKAQKAKPSIVTTVAPPVASKAPTVSVAKPVEREVKAVVSALVDKLDPECQGCAYGCSKHKYCQFCTAGICTKHAESHPFKGWCKMVRCRLGSACPGSTCPFRHKIKKQCATRSNAFVPDLDVIKARAIMVPFEGISYPFWKVNNYVWVPGHCSEYFEKGALKPCKNVTLVGDSLCVLATKQGVGMASLKLGKLCVGPCFLIAYFASKGGIEAQAGEIKSTTIGPDGTIAYDMGSESGTSGGIVWQDGVVGIHLGDGMFVPIPSGPPDFQSDGPASLP